MLEEEQDDDDFFFSLINHEVRPLDAITIVEQKYHVFPDFLLCFLKLTIIGTPLCENLVQDNKNHSSPTDHFLLFHLSFLEVLSLYISFATKRSTYWL